MHALWFDEDQRQVFAEVLARYRLRTTLHYRIKDPESKSRLRTPAPLYLRLTLLFFLLLLGFRLGPTYGGDVKYVYDELGRLTQVIDVQTDLIHTASSSSLSSMSWRI